MRVDAGNVGKTNEWYKKYTKLGWNPVSFPGCFDHEYNVWFSTEFDASNVKLLEGERVLLRFSGMPYYTEYWINGEYVGDHTGRVDAFTFDVTAAIKPGEKNFITIRSTNPTATEDLNGLIYEHIGLAFTSSPRVREPAYLYVKPAVYADDVVVSPDCENGNVEVEITLNNTTSEEKEVTLIASVKQDGKDYRLDRIRKTVTLAPGVSVQTVTLTVDNFRYWSPEDPFLYNCEVEVENSLGYADSVSRLVAFRTLKVNDDGFFELNGKPYYIKGTFGGYTVPVSFDNGEEPEYYYDMIKRYKAMGFNTIRALDNVPIPEVLDLCDRLGMIVYSEHPMAWNKVDAPDGQSKQLFKDSVIGTLKTIRSHPSVLIFGFQNETVVKNAGNTKTSDLYETILSGPSWAREYAEDMVFMLSSGRFDGNASVASASNPGSTTWDGYMGNEDPNAENKTLPSHVSNTYSPAVGDIHYYPLQPYGNSVLTNYEKLESYNRGVFLSEAGTGTIFDVISLIGYREMEDQNLGSAYPEQIDAYRSWFKKYGVDAVFASPEELIAASYKLGAEQRARLTTYVRSIGKMNGYLLTGGMDCNQLGEGIHDEYGQYKDYHFDALYNALSDLRFCITTDSMTYYKGDKIDLRVVISDLAGDLDTTEEYTAYIRFVGENNGMVWEEKYDFMPAGDPFNTTICDEKITADFPADTYTINVEIKEGAVVRCNTETIQIFDKIEDGSLSGRTIYTYKIPRNVNTFLTRMGATMVEYTPGDNVGNGVVLVGNATPTDAQVTQMVEAANGGAHIVFLSKTAIVNEGGNFRRQLGISGSGNLSFDNWLYHGENVIYRNSITAGLQNKCLMDTIYYESVYSPDFFYNAAAPDDVSVGTVFLGGQTPTNSQAFRGGYQLGTYYKGNGCITISALNFAGGLGRPVADTLFMNLLNYQR